MVAPSHRGLGSWRLPSRLWPELASRFLRRRQQPVAQVAFCDADRWIIRRWRPALAARQRDDFDKAGGLFAWAVAAARSRSTDCCVEAMRATRYVSPKQEPRSSHPASHAYAYTCALACACLRTHAYAYVHAHVRTRTFFACASSDETVVIAEKSFHELLDETDDSS